MLFLAALATIGTGDDLLAACVADTQRPACMAMVMGVANGTMLAAQDLHQRLLCVHPGIRPADLVEAVRKYLDAHPELRSKPAATLTYRALRETFPCPEPTSPNP